MVNDAKIDQLISNPEWRQRSTNAIAKHLGTSNYHVRRRRVALNLVPEIVLPLSRNGTPMRNGGVPMRVRNIGRHNGMALTKRQQFLISDTQLLTKADHLAHWKANAVLQYDDLMTVAHNAIILAARHWCPLKQQGKESVPGSKWRAYAVEGIKRAFFRAFSKKRAALRRSALVCDHPYQQWIVRQRLGSEESIFSQAVAHEDDNTIFDAYLNLNPRDKWLIEQIAGLDGKKPWTEQQIANFLDLPVEKVEWMIAAAKAKMQE